MLNEILLTSQLVTKVNPEKLTGAVQQEKIDQVQHVARVEKQSKPNFLRGERKRIIRENRLDTGFTVFPKLNIPELDLKSYNKIEPIGLKFADGSTCSGTIFTQRINGKENKYVVNIGHCWNDKLKLQFQENIQILSTPKLNYQESEILDPAIAIPLEIVQRASNDVQIISLMENITDPRVLKLMQGYNTSLLCDISNPKEFYSLNIITRDQNLAHPENAFQRGVGAMVGEPGKSGSLVIIEGTQKLNKVNSTCLSPRLILSHGTNTPKFNINEKIFAPKPVGDFELGQYYYRPKKPVVTVKQGLTQRTMFLKNSGYIDLNSLDGVIVETQNELPRKIDRQILSPSKQLETLVSPNQLIKSVRFRMNGKEYKITRSQDKTKPDNIITLEN